MTIVKNIETKVENLGESAAHSVMTGEAVTQEKAATKKETNLVNRRRDLKEKLKNEVLRFDRVTEGVVFAFKSRGFQLATMEMIYAKLPLKAPSTLRNLFSQHFYETLFTKRVYVNFYVPSTL